MVGSQSWRAEALPQNYPAQDYGRLFDSTQAAGVGVEIDVAKVPRRDLALGPGHEGGKVRARGHGRLLDGIADRTSGEGHGLLDVWMSHGDKVVSLPAGFTITARTDSAPVAAICCTSFMSCVAMRTVVPSLLSSTKR